MSRTTLNRRQDAPNAQGQAAAQCCDFPGCSCEGIYRAPKSRDPKDGHWRFCLEHVREYNRNWNFFAGMSADEIEAYRRQDIIGHRPTWRLGLKPKNAVYADQPINPIWVKDDLGLLGEVPGLADRFGAPAKPGHKRNPALSPAEREALEVMGLEDTATRDDIKTRYKILAKRHHPDRNKGDITAEERMKRLTQAYGLLMRSDSWR